MKTPTKTKVLELVSEHLRRASLNGITFAVLNGEIEKREGAWHIPVRASAHPASMYEYYDVLVDIEEKLREKHHLNVWLIPTVPDEPSARRRADRPALGVEAANGRNDKVSET